jgi:hypothetical protein
VQVGELEPICTAPSTAENTTGSVACGTPIKADTCVNHAMGSIRFTATLVPRGPAAPIVLEEDQVSTVGEGAKRFPVVATVNG